MNHIPSQELERYRKVQYAARMTMDGMTEFIKPGVSEADLVRKCDELQRAAGVDGYWYKSLPALVLVGENTNLAISQAPYVPRETLVQETDLVTIDLNPSIGGYCGDYARSYYIEGGVARRAPIRDDELLAGAYAQQHLHGLLLRVAHAGMSFGALYNIMREEIDRLGLEQLDYIGHNVQKDMRHLEYIAPGAALTLGDAGLFTLEPQIRLKGGRYGFKHENIYYFHGLKPQEL